MEYTEGSPPRFTMPYLSDRLRSLLCIIAAFAIAFLVPDNSMMNDDEKFHRVVGIVVSMLLLIGSSLAFRSAVREHPVAICWAVPFLPLALIGIYQAWLPDGRHLKHRYQPAVVQPAPAESHGKPR